VSPVDPVSIGSLAKLLADFLTLRTARRDAERRDSIVQFRDFLTRRRDERILEYLERQETRALVEQVLNTGRPRTPRAIEYCFAESRGFEDDYRRIVAGELDEVELFGVDLPEEACKQKLSVAYISLALGSEDDSGPALPVQDVLDGLSDHTGRLLIRGEAGMGKTTLLRWVAIQAAQREEPQSKFARIGRELDREALDDLGASELSEDHAADLVATTPWYERIPFLIYLRDCKQGRLPRLEEFPCQVARHQEKPPEGWVERVLKDGMGLVLIDGLDETPPKYRPSVLRSVRSLARTYPDAWFIVTTRPAAADKDCLADGDFRECAIAPMTPGDRAALIDRWHESVSAELRRQGRADKADETVELADALKDQLANNPPIARLANTPLLAAMICALHRDRRAVLPESQYALVDTLCHVLLWRRERERGQDLSEFPEAYQGLTYAGRRSVLQQLAGYMVKQGRSTVDREKTLKKFEQALRGIKCGQPEKAGEVCQGMVERSGMLREKHDGEFEFIHNTFKEFLAARQFVHVDDELKGLVEKSDDPEWDNILLFAAADPDDTAFGIDLIRRVLPRQAPAPAQKGRKKGTLLASGSYYRRLLIAVRMHAVMEGRDEKIDERIARLERNLFPPRTLRDAEGLAASGGGFESRLHCNPRWGKARRRAAVRALRLLETESAGQLLESYFGDRDWSVIEELALAVNPLVLPAVQRAVQDRFVGTAGDQEFAIRARISDLTPLSGLSNLTALYLAGTGVTDVAPLSGLTNLTTLNLLGTGVKDVSPLSGLTNLTTLKLTGTGVTDVRPLSGLTNLRALYLTRTRVTDVAPLSGLTNLTALNLWGTGVTDVRPLSGLTNLTALYLAFTGVTDVTPLSGLSNLTALYLTRTGVTDVAPLSGLTNLTTLNLLGTGVTDVTPLLGLTNLIHYTGPRIPGRDS
jgi:hypothetical protein